MFEREAPIAPETAWPRGGSSACDILQFDCPSVVSKGDVNGNDDREAFWTWGRTGPVTENVPDPFAGHYNTVSATKLNIYASFKPLESKLIDYSKKHNKQNDLY